MRIETLARAGCAFGLAGLLGAASAAGIGAHAEHGHPAKLHEGSCDDLGRVVASFNGVGGSVDLDGQPVEPAEAVNPERAYQMLRSETATDLVLDEIVAAPHAVMVYESDEDLSGIACGNVGGAGFGDDLAVGLAEANVPGHVGFALFAQGDGQTLVTIYVGHALSPVSAGGGAADGHAHDNGGHEDDHDGENDGDATPEADA